MLGIAPDRHTRGWRRQKRMLAYGSGGGGGGGSDGSGWVALSPRSNAVSSVPTPRRVADDCEITPPPVVSPRQRGSRSRQDRTSRAQKPPCAPEDAPSTSASSTTATAATAATPPSPSPSPALLPGQRAGSREAPTPPERAAHRAASRSRSACLGSKVRRASRSGCAARSHAGRGVRTGGDWVRRGFPSRLRKRASRLPPPREEPGGRYHLAHSGVLCGAGSRYAALSHRRWPSHSPSDASNSSEASAGEAKLGPAALTAARYGGGGRGSIQTVCDELRHGLGATEVPEPERELRLDHATHAASPTLGRACLRDEPDVAPRLR